MDARVQDWAITPKMAKGIGHRHFGVGFDQLAVISNGTGDAHLTFFNADGSTSAACGNATRCIARFLMQESGKTKLHLTTDRGTLLAEDVGDDLGLDAQEALHTLDRSSEGLERLEVLEVTDVGPQPSGHE